MRRIKWIRITGNGPKRAPLLEKPSQRIARRRLEVARNRFFKECVLCVDAKLTRQANGGYRLYCDKCGRTKESPDSFNEWRANKLFVVGGPVISDAELTANRERLRALINGAVPSDQLPPASE